MYHYTLNLIVLLSINLFVQAGSYDKYKVFPENPTKAELDDYHSRNKLALLKYSQTILKRNTDEANVCDVLDSIMMDEAMEISKLIYSDLKESAKEQGDYIDVFLMSAAQLPTFNDLMEPICNLFKRGTHKEMIEGLEIIAKKSFSDAVATESNPISKFETLRNSVVYLADMFMQRTSK